VAVPLALVARAEWSGARCVELGAGVGLCALVCARLGMRVAATDGDASVLAALKANAARDEVAQRLEVAAALPAAAGAAAFRGRRREGGALRARLLRWGDAKGATRLRRLWARGASIAGGEEAGEVDVMEDEEDEDEDEEEEKGEVEDGSGKAFDLVLATGCVYGRDAGVWQQLGATLVALSSKSTLVLLAHGTGAAPGTHALQGDFYALVQPWFAVGRAPPACGHPDHPGVQV
jgi:hypothetical protein